MRTRLSSLSALTVLIITIWVRPTLAQQALEPVNQNLLYTVIGDSLVAFGWSPEDEQFAQVWSSAPTRYRSTSRRSRLWRPIDWLIPMKSGSEGEAPSILAMDYFGLLIFESQNRYPRYLPFRDVIGSLLQAVPWSLAERSVFLIQREQWGKPSAPRSIEVMDLSVTPLTPLNRGKGAATFTWSLELADLDLDGTPEVLTGGGDIHVFHITESGQVVLWGIVPFAGTPDVIRVGDVDGDQLPEIVVSGNNQRVTVYDVRKARFDDSRVFPVAWVSDDLGGFTQGLALADLNAQPPMEIITATTPTPGQRAEHGKLYIFEIDKDITPWQYEYRSSQLNYLTRLTASCPRASIPGIAVGDLTGNGSSEIVVNGVVVYHTDFQKAPWQITRVDTLYDDSRGTGEALILPPLKVPSDVEDIPAERWLLNNLENEHQSDDNPIAGDEFQLFPIIENAWGRSRECTLRIGTTKPGLEIVRNNVHVPSISPATMHRNEEAFIFRTEPTDSLTYYPVIIERMLDNDIFQRYEHLITVNPKIEIRWPLFIVDLWASWAPEVTQQADVFRGNQWGGLYPKREEYLAHDALLLIDWGGINIEHNLPILEEGIDQKIAIIGGYFFDMLSESDRLEHVIHALRDTLHEAGNHVRSADTAPPWWPQLSFTLSENQDAEALIPAYGSRPLLIDHEGNVIGVWWEEPSPGAFISIAQFPQIEGGTHEKVTIEALIKLISEKP